MTHREVIWHDVENGSYAADLELWRELAADADGPILDLGAGTGRVARDLYAAGHEVHALDSDPELLAALRERAPGVTTHTGDARSFSTDERFALILAPMQLVQILGGPAARLAMLERVHEHLLPGGRFAAAIANPYDAVAEEDRSPPYPDMLEHDGWVYSSQPVMVSEQRGQVIVERRRQAVAPDGTLDEQLVPFALDVIDADELEREARFAGLVPVARHAIPETTDHIGSMVVECRR
jgi:SAM-dependent methyltransferase